MSRAEEIRARLEAATPGPWRHRRDGDTGYLVEAHLPCINGLSAWFTVSVVWHPTTAEIGYTDGAIWDAEDSATLIANAPADLAWLIGEVERERARADAAEAALATADANLDESQRHNVEVSKLATDWMNAHDSLKAGQPYKLPSPVPVAQLIATADAAGFARGVEAAAGVADEVSGRDDVPLLLRKSIWVAVRKDCASEIAAAIRALVPS